MSVNPVMHTSLLQMIGTTGVNFQNSTFDLLASMTPPSQFPFSKVAMGVIADSVNGICSINLNSDDAGGVSTCPLSLGRGPFVVDFSDKVMVRHAL